MIGKLALAGAAVFALSGPASAGELNPVFGKAKAVEISQSDAKNVVGKGAASIYYGYYANYYNALAGYYGSYSTLYDTQGYNANYTYYYTAYQYANTAATLYYYAYYYKVTQG